MPTFSPSALTAFSQSLFEAAGVPAADAAVVARSLVDANLCGHDSHGVMRVPQYIEFIRKGTYKPGVELTVLSETPAVLATDANWGLGQVQAHRLLGRLIEKAKPLGVAAGTLRNCGHTGRLGEYAEAAARAVRIHRSEERHLLPRRYLGVLAEPTGVAAVPQRPGRDAECLRLRQQFLQ